MIPTSTLVSVIIPVYNMEQWLGETLDSVLASDYPALEIIIVNDGSTDDTGQIAANYAARDSRVRVFSVSNSGVSHARNYGIRQAKGLLIFPVDGDNTIEPWLISELVSLMNDEVVKVVCPKADFFGERSGEWKLPPYSIHLLARKNMMDTCALFRRSDWERAGGYREDMPFREDWIFWISVLKDGGEVIRSQRIGLHYRIRPGSKRITDRLHKRELVKLLNQLYPDLFLRELHGPLRYHRSWSVIINRITNIVGCQSFRTAPEFQELGGWVCRLPQSFDREGKVVYEGRNTLKQIIVPAGGLDRAEQAARLKATGLASGPETTVVVKSFQRPVWLRRLIYGWVVKSKARRSFEYACLLKDKGLETPAPVAYVERRRWGLLQDSYYVSLASTLPLTMNDLIGHPELPHRDAYLDAVARYTARLHDEGICHADYSCGNILLGMENGEPKVEVIDLNRLHFGTVGQKAGCRNFERINIDRAALSLMARSYARARGFDEETCVADILAMRWKKHVRQGITHLDD